MHVCVSVERDTLYGKRDLIIWQKSPVHISIPEICVYVSKETAHMAKETYMYGKRDLIMLPERGMACNGGGHVDICVRDIRVRDIRVLRACAIGGQESLELTKQRHCLLHLVHLDKVCVRLKTGLSYSKKRPITRIP